MNFNKLPYSDFPLPKLQVDKFNFIKCVKTKCGNHLEKCSTAKKEFDA